MPWSGRALLVAAATSAAAIALAGCDAVKGVYGSMQDAFAVSKAVARETQGGAVNVKLFAGRVLQVGLINSPLAQRPAAEHQRLLKDVARIAFRNCRAREGLDKVVVSFIAQEGLEGFSTSNATEGAYFSARELVPERREGPAWLVVRQVTPSAYSAIESGGVLDATLEYAIEGMPAGDERLFSLSALFETDEEGREVSSDDETPVPLAAASGTLHYRLPIDAVLAIRDLGRPVILRFFLMKKQEGSSVLPIAQTDPILYLHD